MNDYRRAKRRKVTFVIDVVDCMQDEVIGRIANLSESGILIVANRRVNPDALYQLRFQLDEGDGLGSTVEVGAHELWADEAAAPGQVWTGFRFIDLAPKDLAAIRAWVEAPGSQYV